MRTDTLFGLEEHMAKLNCKANPLVRLAETIDFDCFLEPLERGLGYGHRRQRTPLSRLIALRFMMRDRGGGNGTSLAYNYLLRGGP